MVLSLPPSLNLPEDPTGWAISPLSTGVPAFSRLRAPTPEPTPPFPTEPSLINSFAIPTCSAACRAERAPDHTFIDSFSSFTGHDPAPGNHLGIAARREKDICLWTGLCKELTEPGTQTVRGSCAFHRRDSEMDAEGEAGFTRRWREALTLGGGSGLAEGCRCTGTQDERGFGGRVAVAWRGAE